MHSSKKSQERKVTLQPVSAARSRLPPKFQGIGRSRDLSCALQRGRPSRRGRHRKSRRHDLCQSGRGVAASQSRAGSPLAVTSAKWSSAAPDVPTIAESGLPGYEFSSWFGVLAPASSRPASSKSSNAEIVKALRSPDITARLSAEGAELIAGTPEEFDTFLKSETAKWTKVIGAAGIQQIE